MLIASLFLIAKNNNKKKKNHPRCSSTRYKLWYSNIVEYHSATKRTTVTHNMDESQKHCDKRIKSDMEQFILYESNYVKFQERQNELRVSEIRSMIVWGEGRGDRKAGRSSWEMMEICYILIVVAARSQQSFLQRANNILSSEDHMVSVTTTNFCCYSMKPDINNMSTSGCGCIWLKSPIC